MKKRRGISLIVLVITIIVIVVLAVAVIVSLANNNPVENSKEATFKNDLASIKEAMNLASTDILLEKVKANEAYNNLIPSKYTDKLDIQSGILYYIGADAEEEEWARQAEVIKGEKLPEDWIDISKSTPEDGISLLIGKPADEEATIKFKVTSTGTYSVNWGDGTSTTLIASETEAIHTYSTNNDKSSTDGYLFEVNITPDGGEITKFQHTQDTNSPLLWCQVGCDTLTDCTSMLNKAINLRRFGTTTNTSLDQVENMYGMFRGCSSLTSIPLLNTSSVTNMGDMFRGCSSLKTIPELNTSKVENMGCMFFECRNLIENPELDTSNVTYMYNMFQFCTNLKRISKLDISNAENLSYMFYGCSSLTEIPKLDTSKVLYMNMMFFECTNLTGVQHLNMSSALNKDAIFINCNNLEGVNISNSGIESYQLNAILSQLPISTKNAVIDITGNPGESGCIKEIATEKGWVVIP